MPIFEAERGRIICVRVMEWGFRWVDAFSVVWLVKGLRVFRKFAVHSIFGCAWRGARVVMEQIANLSTGNRCQGSNPCLSAKKPGLTPGFFMP